MSDLSSPTSMLEEAVWSMSHLTMHHHLINCPYGKSNSTKPNWTSACQRNVQSKKRYGTGRKGND